MKQGEGEMKQLNIEIIPAIDLKGGKIVRLKQGNYSDETLYDSTPQAFIDHWLEMGVKRLHIVDLDTAVNGQCSTDNTKSIEAIACRYKDQLKIQVGGGIRDEATIQKYFKLGVDKVIIGTLFFKNSELYEYLFNNYGQKIILALDTNNGFVCHSGWQTSSNEKLMRVLEQYRTLLPMEVMVTDIQKDGMLEGPNFELMSQLVAFGNKNQINFIASGGISSSEDIAKLDELSVKTVIVGKALLEGRIL